MPGRRPIPAKNLDLDKPIPGLRSEFIFHEIVQGSKRLNGRDNAELGTNPFFQHIDQAVGPGGEESFEVITDERSASAPKTG